MSDETVDTTKPVEEVKPSRVVTTSKNDPRVLFRGLHEDAEEFVKNHFPRPHIEPGRFDDTLRYDAHILDGSGNATHYNGKGFSPVPETE